jgi:hypothetical protein
MISFRRVIQTTVHTAFLIALLTTLIAPAAAISSGIKTEASVAINPPISVTRIGQTITVELYLNSVTDLWGGQVALDFDPAILKVVDAAGNPATKIQRGTFLNPARVTEVINVADNTAGRIEYAATLRNDPHNPVPPASGSGSFAIIKFKGIALGSSPVTFSVEGANFVHEQLFVQLIDYNLQPIVLPTEDGLVNVLSSNGIYLPLILNNSSSKVTQISPEATPTQVTLAQPEFGNQPWSEGWLQTSPPEGWYAPFAVPFDTPELYVSILNAFDMFFVGNIAYYTKQSTLEFCDSSSPHIIASVDTTNHAEATLLSGCNLKPGRLVADSSYIYFQDWQTDTIRRIPVSGGSTVILAYATNVDKHRGLASDGSYIYFDDDIGLKRVPIGGGSVEILVTGYEQSQLAVDAAYVYWTERSQGGMDLGAIRRVPNTGGNSNVLTLISAPNVNDPNSLAVDGTNLYWIEDGGRVRQIPKAGGAPIDYCPADPSYQPGSIVLNSSYVFWSDSLNGTNGRLRRAPKGGGQVTDLVLGGIFEPLSIGLTGTHIFWIARDGIFRLSLGAQPVKIDLSINGMEVTQGIQNMANDVPLVTEKATYVRVYPAVDLADTPHVTMSLRGYNNGFELPGSPLQPVWPELLVYKSGTHREHLAESFLFYIPTSWRANTIELRAEINPGNVIPESNTGNNTFSRTVTFNPKAPVCVVFVPVRTHGSPASTDMPGFFSIIGRMVSLWPISGIHGYTQDSDIAFQGLSGDEPYDLPDDNNWVITKLWWRDLWTIDPCDQTYYVGMVSADTPTGSSLGYGSYVSHDSWVKMETGSISGYWGHPWYESRGGFTLAHEMSHNSNGFFSDRWKHVDCPKGGVPDLTSVYPYDSCQLDVPGPANHYGFDTWIDPHSVIPPETTADYMSYEEPNKWISDYNYKGMYQELSGGGEFSSVPSLDWSTVDEYLLVSGIITPTTNTAAFDPGFRITQELAAGSKLSQLVSQQNAVQAAGITGAFTFVLVAANNSIIYSQSFDPEPAMVTDPGTSPSLARLFHLAAPWNDNTAFVRILSGTTVLAQLDVTANTPQVTLLQPNGGNIIDDSLNVRWTGSDDDDDRLFYTVQYSPDNGTTWRAVATNVVTTTLTISSTQGLPSGTQGLIRVIATDGVNTSMDNSDAIFTVNNHAPKPYIDTPHDGAVYPPGQQITLRGGAFDADGADISGDMLEWFVDDINIGYGAEAVANGLTAGPHTITLQATDGQESAQTEVNITIQEMACSTNKKVDIVFLLDTSPDMETHFGDACTQILYTVWGLSGAGYDVNPKVLGISQTAACASGNVSSLFPGGAVDNPAAWGAGVMEIAGRYDWKPGYTRLIVPITNHGAAGTGIVQDPGIDRDAINAAIAAAQLNHVTVAPLIMPPYDEMQRPAIVSLASDLAANTGGRVYQFGDPSMTIYFDLPNIVQTVACAPKLFGVSPACEINEETTLTLFGENLAAGAQFYVGNTMIADASPNQDGTQVTFHMPPGQLVGRTYDVRAELPGAGSDLLSGAITFGTCTDRCDDYQIGDVVAPMWILEDGDMTFQAKANSSSLQINAYAADSLTNVTLYDLVGNPINSIQVGADQTQFLTSQVTSGETYQIIVSTQRNGARFRLMVRGVEWLRLPDDGDDWSGGYNGGSGEDKGVESSVELGFGKRWSDTPASFADTTWFFNVVSGDEQFKSQACLESVYGDANRSTRWTDANGQWRASTWGAGTVLGCTSFWSGNPAPGYWSMQLFSEPPYSPWPQRYTVAKADNGGDDFVYLLPESMVGPTCGPSVVLSPATGAYCSDKVFRMDIVVADVVDLYGAEVHAQFNPSMLEAVDEQGNPVYEVVPGSLLDPANGLIGINSVDNVGGYIDYAISLMDPAQSVSGGGILATVYFRAKTTGSTTVQINQVKLSAKPNPPQPGTPIPAVTRNASFNVNSCIPTGAMIGQVYLDGRTVHAGASVTVDPGGNAAQTFPNGSFELPSLIAGQYSVDITHTSYLRAGPRLFTVTTGNTLDLGNVTLLGGDCNNDDKINILDAAIVAYVFALANVDPGFDSKADINGDGVVDIYDLVMVGNNFGCALDDVTIRCQRWDRP